MSDKFFFKGRQDARLDHRNHGFKTNANKKLGTKKYPLTLQVLTEQRKAEVSAIVEQAQLHADITVNTDEHAQESIEQLTTILNKPQTITFDKPPSRNDPCHCGSGVKFKKCCG